MDKIQKELIKAGRKDLAQEYFEKTAAINASKIVQMYASGFGEALAGNFNAVKLLTDRIKDKLERASDKELKDVANKAKQMNMKQIDTIDKLKYHLGLIK